MERVSGTFYRWPHLVQLVRLITPPILSKGLGNPTEDWKKNPFGTLVGLGGTHSRRGLLNVVNFEYLQSGDSPGILSVKELKKKTN